MIATTTLMMTVAVIALECSSASGDDRRLTSCPWQLTTGGDGGVVNPGSGLHLRNVVNKRFLRHGRKKIGIDLTWAKGATPPPDLGRSRSSVPTPTTALRSATASGSPCTSKGSAT